jgi:hypothetical protein
MIWEGHIAHGKYEKCIQILVGKPRRRWEDNIRKDLREIGSEGVDWIHLAQDGDHWRALVNTLMKLGLCKGRRIS